MAGLSEEAPAGEEAPAEVSMDKAAADRALDEKLRRAADRTRQTYKADAAGKVSNDPLLRRLVELSPTPGDQVVGRIQRIAEEEGDPLPVPAEVRRNIVPDRFTAAAFATYRAETPSQKTALGAVRRWAAEAAAGRGMMLALIGSTGVGKSHLLYAAANELLEKGARTYARGWYRLADELRYGGGSPFRPGQLEAFEVRALLWGQRVVLLDEVRPTASTAFDDTELAKFACHAYDQRLAVLITTNVSPLAEVMGPPAASRFTQVVVEGQDRRQG